jgi:hypothetical protein
MATAPTTALPCMDMGAVSYAKVMAMPVVVVTGGDPPTAPVNAVPVVVVTAGAVPLRETNAQPIVWAAGGDPVNKTTPIPVVIVG